ncbi:MAG: cytochrome b N-terminal domain-containing protein [Verrucomicrobia bacterium]|nr:cytochrome b N-terminal domain-containing protein [Verrucomicrobiota bacterium]
MAKRWRTWISDRFGLRRVYEGTLNRRVAKSSWYYGDGATLTFLLGVLVVTGMFMSLTYTPSPDGAYESIRFITEKQVLGWFVRGLHYWAAGMMVVMLFFHLFRQILVGGYKFPREGTWLIGVILFFAIILMSFTGYLLRWDERSIYALKVAQHMFSRLPWIGESVVVFIQGGTEPGATTLTRLYAVHVIFVPVLLGLFVIWHIYLVIIHGVTSQEERNQPIYTASQQRQLYRAQARSREKGENFFPMTVFKSGLMATIVFAIVLTLTLTLGPQRLYPEADLTTISRPIEEWWFYWYSGLIALLPNTIAPWFVVIFPIVLFIILILLPFIDRSPWRGFKKRLWPPIVVGICVIGILYLTDLRRRSPWTGWPDSEPPPVPAGVVLSPEAEQGRQLFAQYGCNSCHPISGHGRKVAVDFGQIERRLSQDYIRDYILQPPEGIAMPGYRGRMSAQDLERIVEFVLVAQTFPRSQ